MHQNKNGKPMLHSDYYSNQLLNLIKEQYHLIDEALLYNDIISFEENSPTFRNGSFVKNILKLNGWWYATIVGDGQPEHLALLNMNAEMLNQIIVALENQKIL